MALYRAITNFNIEQETDYEGPKPKAYSDANIHYYKYSNINSQIVFESDFLACPCVYYVKKNELFCFSFDPDLVVAFAKEHGIELTDTYENLSKINDNIRSHIKPSVTKRYKYNLNYIEQWKKIVLNYDGSFEVTKNEFEPFTLSIKDNYDKFKAFLLKYKHLAENEIIANRFIPTLTGGLDSRTFLGLYRDYINDFDGYFLTAVKQDGKNNIKAGELELALADNVARIIGLNPVRHESLDEADKHYTTMTGMFNENAEEYENPNDIEYITKYVQHGYDNSHQYINKLVPYIDDDYLQFKQRGEITRLLLLVLLVPDLINAPFISGTSLYNHFPNGMTLMSDSRVFDVLSEINKILDYWGPEKVKNILKEDC